MVFLSKLLNKKVYANGKPFGKLIDMAIFETKNNPPVSKFEIRTPKQKLTVSPSALKFDGNKFTISSSHIPLLPYDHKDFYLSEDLLDKQVIDVDGRRLVRVNDVALDNVEDLKVIGIDIGTGAILRRLGLNMFHVKEKILPWQLVEAFDYQTGNVHIKLKQTSLNKLHPAEIAEILEEVGAKERIGIVDALDPDTAVEALEETDDQTQASILENLKPDSVKSLVERMHLSHLADILKFLNPPKARQIEEAVGEEKTRGIKRLLSFSENSAGNLMHMNYFKSDGERTVKEILDDFERLESVPETIVVTNGNGKLAGIIASKDLLRIEKLAKLKDIIEDKKFVFPETDLETIIKLLAHYNLRIVPVVDTEKKPIGIVLIDDILRIIEQENNNEVL